MKETIIIPLFENRVSPRLDYAQQFILFTHEYGKIQKQESINIITNNRLERINRIILLKPQTIICNGLTERCYVELTKAKIQVIPWIQGEIEETLQKYFSGYLRESGKHTFGHKTN